MTDKIQKIREGIKKRYEYWKEKESNSHNIESEARMSECKHLLLMLDSLQEEPVIVDAPPYDYVKGFSDGRLYEKRQKEEPASEDLGDYINKLSKQFPEISFAKLSQIAVSVSRWQQNQDVKNKQPKVTNRTELDEYAYQCAYDMSNDWVIENPTWHDVEDACKLGANWQKEQDQETIELAEDHAMLAGMIKGKEEAVKKTINFLNWIIGTGNSTIEEYKKYINN